MWFGTNPQEVAMGDWYPDPDPRFPGRWRYDKAAPTPGESPAVTAMLPVVHLPDVPPRADDWCEDRDPSTLTDQDGTE